MAQVVRLRNIMKDSTHILAWLLAAEEHPHLQETPEYQAAFRALQASDDLQARFEESKLFLARHPVLTRIEGLPAESRARIEAVLKTRMKKLPEGKLVTLNPWSVRKHFAWAAILVLLLAGMSVMSSYIIQHQDHDTRIARHVPPQEAFYQFIGQLAERRMPLQVRDNDNTRLVSWLNEQGADAFVTPPGLSGKETMGCAYLDGPDGKIALICFKTENGIVHLFVTSSESLDLVGRSPGKPLLVNGRHAMEWHDEANAYLLLTHDKDQALPEVFL
jgi:hypothetical protein